MWLVVGLGNPGSQYARNRHNVGFRAIELCATRWGAGPWKEKFSGLWTKASFAGEELALLMPQTYMNLSGESVQKAMAFFKVPLASVLVLHDELDLPWKDVRIKLGGGHAGHNGIRSIMQHCGTDFVRVRMGIGPVSPEGSAPGPRRPRGTTESWVLGDFDAMESAEIPDVIERAAIATEAVLKSGVAAAMNQVHGKPARPGKPAPKP
jgi:PTH1 family peptidyl-tRNA hydrolase